MKKFSFIIALLLVIAIAGYFLLHSPLLPPAHTQGGATATTTATSTLPIVVDSPKAGDVLTSPLTITGKARGNWYFEASFPVRLEDSHGNTIAQAPAQAEGDWMTADFVPFKATLTFKNPGTPTGVLILHNDNPSGDPAHDQEIEVQVRFSQ